MQRSTQPRIELERAERALLGMKSSTSLDEFEECWRYFLTHLERVWNKSVNHFSKSGKWQSWHGKYLSARRKDQLLSYLINARGAEEHTVESIITRSPEGWGIMPPEPYGEMRIRTFTDESGNYVMQTTPGSKVVFFPSETQLLPVTNRGRTYDVPRKHLGEDIVPEDIPSLADKALLFYRGFLDDAEKYFYG